MRDGLRLTFIGGGNMAAALIAGLAGQLTASENINVVDPNADQLTRLATHFGVRTLAGFDGAATDVIVLAVKPQSMREAASAMAGRIAPSTLVISIAAGIRSVELSRWLGGHAAIVRCMPNTPALIGQGITGMVAAPGVSAEHRALAQDVLAAVGAVVWLDDESLIDAVTAVSGSGPAYVFYFIEAMQQAAVELGLTPAQGMQLALATFTGASQLAARSEDSVAALRERVTSKGGTTYAALQSLEGAGVKQAIVEAVKAAAARGREMGDELAG